ncbi:uncharacterized protein LOC126824241 isoform X2 [Patella vulgata]|uniref:uncharacterized protein LOC126824241 isoform X2 n=1 Tax=Patella vulgata TaxID=6465 RepID=UPI00217FFDF3|nr:uncharacterized protein LOC126824241 isoform X2 [Patella vulgata]
MWSWIGQYHSDFLHTEIGGYEGRPPSKVSFSRNKKCPKHEMELVGKWSAVDGLKLEPILSNYPKIRKSIKNKLNSEKGLEDSTYIYYNYYYIVPVVFSDSDKWNLEEEMWSLDSVIIRKKESQGFLKYFNTSTSSNKKLCDCVPDNSRIITGSWEFKMWSWMEKHHLGIGGYARGPPSKFMLSRNKKSRKHEMELVGEWSAVDGLKLEPILSNYPKIRKSIKNKLNSEKGLEDSTYIYYDCNYMVPVVFTDSDKWNLEEEMWSLDSVIIRKKESQEFLKYFITSTRNSKKGRLGKMTKKHEFQSDQDSSSFPNILRFVEHQLKEPKNNDCYIHLYFDVSYGNVHCDTETFKLETELISLREKLLHSVSTSNPNYRYGSVLVFLAPLLIRVLRLCTTIKIQIAVFLMLVGPVTTDVLPDSVFEWKNTTNPVISTMRQRIALEWKYESKEPVSSMVFTRFRNSADHKVPVGKWTKEEGFKPDPFISTELNLVTVHINGTNEKKVSLILENPIHIDYDLQYNCQVNCGDPLPRNNMSIELRALKPKWTDYEVGKNATLGQDVTFMLEYKYPFKAIAVFIRRENNSNSEMVKLNIHLIEDTLWEIR